MEKKNVTGSVVMRDTIYGSIKDPGRLSGSVTMVQYYRPPDYNGAYKVTPKMEEIVLETNNKLMHNDVTVEKIPVYETTNQTGGTTVYIAMEV